MKKTIILDDKSMIDEIFKDSVCAVALFRFVNFCSMSVTMFVIIMSTSTTICLLIIYN